MLLKFNVMLPVCLQDIVSIKNICEPDLFVESTSGFDIFDAPEINVSMISSLGTVEKTSGIETLKSIRSNSLKEFNIDFINHLTANGLIPNLSESKKISSGDFNMTNTNPVYAGKRGIVITSVNPDGLRRVVVNKLKILPKQSGNFQLDILDEYNNLKTTLTLALVADSVNEFYINYPISGTKAKFLLDNAALETQSSVITCLKGCNGTKPNKCGYVSGWDGIKEVKTEGFGLVAEFACQCDYSYLICKLAKSYVGKLIFTKMRIGVIEHALFNNRLTNWIIYGKEERDALLKDLQSEYMGLFNTLTQTLPHQTLHYQKEGCIECKGISVKVNV